MTNTDAAETSIEASRLARRSARPARAIRGTTAATAATLIAATAHTLAGGGAPPPLLVVAVALLATPLAVALAGRSLSLWRLALTVLASQALFHTAFALAATADGTASSGAHVHDALVAASVDGAGRAASLTLDPLMLFGHVVAALLTIAALHRGERMLRALGRGILRLCRPRVGLPRTLRAPRVCAIVEPRPFARTALFLSELSRRGPPQVVSALR